MAGVINFVASDFIENIDSSNDNFHTRQSSYSYSKSSFKKLLSKRFADNRNSNMVINNASGYSASTNPIQITIDGTTTLNAKVRRGQTLALQGVGGSLGTVRSVYPDGTLSTTPTQLSLYDIVLNSLSQDLPDNTKIYFSSDEAIIYLQFDTEGDLVDRDQVYLIIDQRYINVVVDQISKELTTGGYTTISPNSTTGIGRHITYIGVTEGEAFLLE